MLLPERRNELTYSLRTRRHDRTLSLDSLTIILLYGSFLKIVIIIYSLIIVFVRLVMFIKRICYVMLLFKVTGYHVRYTSGNNLKIVI